jgi:hypothetical protein
MSFKTQTILIYPARLDGGPDQLLARLGYEKRRKIEDTPFTHAGRGSIWIGSIGDCIILYWYGAADFFDEQPPEEDFVKLKNALLRHFSDSEIAPLFLDGRTGAWGFAVFRHGVSVRRQYGIDGMTLCDEGSRLPIEEAFLAKLHRTDTDQGIRYVDPAHPDYEMGPSDLGDALVFEIARAYTGQLLDQFDPPGTSFWLDDDEAKYPALDAVPTSPQPSRPWWKFWG